MTLKTSNPAAGGRAGPLDIKAVAASDIQNSKSRIRLQHLGLTARCICGLDPSLSGAISFYFPEAPDRITAVEDMPVVAGEVASATLAARIAQMRPDLEVVASTFKFGKAARWRCKHSQKHLNILRGSETTIARGQHCSPRMAHFSKPHRFAKTAALGTTKTAGHMAILANLKLGT